MLPVLVVSLASSMDLDPSIAVVCVKPQSKGLAVESSLHFVAAEASVAAVGRGTGSRIFASLLSLFFDHLRLFVRTFRISVAVASQPAAGAATAQGCEPTTHRT